VIAQREDRRRLLASAEEALLPNLAGRSLVGDTISVRGAAPPQLMGHRDTRSVEGYAKLDSSAIRAGLDRLSKRGRDNE
jgi:hypothetical protein